MAFHPPMVRELKAFAQVCSSFGQSLVIYLEGKFSLSLRSSFLQYSLGSVELLRL